MAKPSSIQAANACGSASFNALAPWLPPITSARITLPGVYGAGSKRMRNGTPVTPPVSSDILESITRETVIQLLREAHGLEVVEREVDRTELYVADEVFLAGTGLGVTPVGVVDRFEVADTSPGPVTSAIGVTYAAVVSGDTDAHPEWRTPVYP